MISYIFVELYSEFYALPYLHYTCPVLALTFERGHHPLARDTLLQERTVAS